MAKAEGEDETMQKRLALHCVLLALLAVKPLTAEDVSPQEQLKAWGEDFVGTWEMETTLDTDVPGLGKKGDTMSGEAAFEAANGLYRGTFVASVNGQPADAGVAAIGWDAARKKVRVQWFTKQGATATGVYTKMGKKWRMRWTLHSPDGTTSTNITTIAIKEKSHVHLLKNRKRGEESLPDKEETWTRKK